MSVAVLAPPPTGPSAAVGLLGRVHEAIDELQAALESGDPSGRELGRLVSACDRATSRLAAVKLALVATAERRGVAKEFGLPSTGSWLARATRADQAATAREATLATALARESDRAPGGAATRTALAEGELSVAHATVITRAIAQLPAGLTPAQVVTVETDLVTRAKTTDPTTLRRLARRALARVEPDTTIVDGHHHDVLHNEETAARVRARLTLHDNHDGTTTGHFTVPTLAAAMLSKVVHAIASPRRARLGATHAQAGSDQGPGTDWAHRRGLAFVEILEHLPTDHLHAPVAATVVVTIDEETLRDRVAAAKLDTGEEITAGQARRLACNAGLLPAVLGGASTPIDLGRKARFFTHAQQAAASLAWDGCAADGCDRPLAWCEWHHRRPWSQDGPTDLANAVPLCGWHHQRIHDSDHLHRWTVHGSVTFHRRT